MIDIENVKIQGVYSSRNKAEAQVLEDSGNDVVEWTVR